MPKEELEALTVEELKAKCKELGLEGYSNLKKDDLISLILGDDGKNQKEELEALTVEELKAKCKELGLEGYSNLKKDDLISLILGDDGKNQKEELEEEIFTLNALRCCKTETKGEVLGKFKISESDYKKDEKIQRFIEIGFILEAD